MSEHDGGTDPYRTPPSQPSPSSGYPGGPVEPDRTTQPSTVSQLRQVMLAGAVAAVLQGVYGAFVLDDLIADSAADLEQVAVESGIDPDRLTEIAGSGALVAVVVGTLITAGLWLLFARLFDRGTGRVVGTVLGVANLLTLLVGLLAPTDLVEWGLTAVSTVLVVTGLVLLWRPMTTAWFRAVAAAKAQRAWG